MDLQLQIQENGLNAFQQNIQPQRVAGLFLYLSGTNAAAQTATMEDAGSVVIKRKGTTIVNRKLSTIAAMNDIRTGSNLFSSTTAGAFKATVFIPFYAIGLEQALNIREVNELNFSYQPAGTVGTVFTALNVSVYAAQSFKEEAYQYFILGDDQTESAAVTARPYPLNRDNITEIYLRDADAVLSSVALRQNGKQVFSDQPKDVLEGITLLTNRLETTTVSMLELQTYTFGEPLSTVNANSVIELTTSGSGTIEVTHCSIKWPPYNS